MIFIINFSIIYLHSTQNLIGTINGYIYFSVHAGMDAGNSHIDLYATVCYQHKFNVFLYHICCGQLVASTFHVKLDHHVIQLSCSHSLTWYSQTHTCTATGVCTC